MTSSDGDAWLAAAVTAWRPARDRLTDRIARYDDGLCRHLDACFDALAAVAGTGRPGVVAVAEALAAAARAATFGESADDRRAPGHPQAVGPVPTRPEGPLLPDPCPEVAPWAPVLDAALRELLLAADVQEYVDARANAACYRRAAQHLMRAARGRSADG